VAEIRTQQATVKRLAGGKGVVVEEITKDGDREFKAYFTVWLGDGHGLSVGDAARFYGQHSVKKTEKDGKVYVDVNINRGQVVADTLVKAQPREAWGAAGEQPSGGWGG